MTRIVETGWPGSYSYTNYSYHYEYIQHTGILLPTTTAAQARYNRPFLFVIKHV